MDYLHPYLARTNSVDGVLVNRFDGNCRRSGCCRFHFIVHVNFGLMYERMYAIYIIKSI